MLLLNVCAQGVLKLNGKLRETNKGVEGGRGIPTERGNPTLAFLGAVGGVFSGCLEDFVAKSKWGEAICFVLMSAAAHVRTSVCATIHTLVNVRLQQTSSGRREI